MDQNMNPAEKPRRKTLERQSPLSHSPDKSHFAEERSQSLPNKIPKIVTGNHEDYKDMSIDLPEIKIHSRSHSLPQTHTLPSSTSHHPFMLEPKGGSKDSFIRSPANTAPHLANSKSRSLDKLSVLSGMMPSSNAGRKRKHPIKPGKHICKYCGKGCAKPSVLEKHIRMHTGERPFPCDICGQSFKTKSNLYKHRKSQAHVAKLKEKGLTQEASLDESRDESMDQAEDSDEEVLSNHASYSRSGSFGSTNSFDIINKRQESFGCVDSSGLPSIPPKDREMYIDALRQLEAADDCIDKRAAAAGFLSKTCEFKLSGRNVVLKFTLKKTAVSSVSTDRQSSPVLGPKFGNKLKQLIPTKSDGTPPTVTSTMSQSNSMDQGEVPDSMNERIAKIIKENQEIVSNASHIPVVVPAAVAPGGTVRRRISRQSSVSSPATSMFSSATLPSQPSTSAPTPTVSSSARLSSLPEDGNQLSIINIKGLEKEMVKAIRAAIPQPDGADSLVEILDATAGELSATIVIKLPPVPSYITDMTLSNTHTIMIKPSGQQLDAPSSCPSCHSIFSREYTQNIHQTFYCVEPRGGEVTKVKMEPLKAPVPKPLSFMTRHVTEHTDTHHSLFQAEERLIKFRKTGSEETYILSHDGLELCDPQKRLNRSHSDMPMSMIDGRSRSILNQSSADHGLGDATSTRQHLKQHILIKNRSQGSLDPPGQTTSSSMSPPPSSSPYIPATVPIVALMTTSESTSTTNRSILASKSLLQTSIDKSDKPSSHSSPLRRKSTSIDGNSQITSSIPLKVKRITDQSPSLIGQPEKGPQIVHQVQVKPPNVIERPSNHTLLRPDQIINSTLPNRAAMYSKLQQPEPIKTGGSQSQPVVQCKITPTGIKYMTSVDDEQKSRIAATRPQVVISNDKYTVSSGVPTSGPSRSLLCQEEPLDLIKTSSSTKTSSATSTWVQHSPASICSVPVLPPVSIVTSTRPSSTVPSNTANQIIRSQFLPTSNHPLSLHVMANQRTNQVSNKGNPGTFGGFNVEFKTTYCTLNKCKPTQIVSAPRFSNYAMWTPCKAPTHTLTIDFKVPLSAYNSNRLFAGTPYKLARLVNRSILTHSSYWKYKNKIRFMSDMPSQQSVSETNVASPSPLALTSSSTVISSIIKPGVTSSSDGRSIAAQADIKQGSVKTEESKSQLNLPLTNDTRPSVITIDNSKKTLLRSQSTPTGDAREKVIPGGFQSDEDYVYVRGRGKGQYVCKQCGIRCRKPSMLKKHIRTHTDLRPYSCKHCKFSFKTKGNLTKHMKSKAHHRRCLELKILPVPTSVDDSQIDSEILANQQKISRESHIQGKEDASDDSDDEGMPFDDDGCDSDGDESSSEGQLQIDEASEDIEADSMDCSVPPLPVSGAAALRRAQSMPAHHMANSFDAEALDLNESDEQKASYPQPPFKKRKRNYLELSRQSSTQHSNLTRSEDDAAMMLLSLATGPVQPAIPNIPVNNSEAYPGSKIDHLIGALTASQSIEAEEKPKDVKRVSVVMSAKGSLESQSSLVEDGNDQPIDLSNKTPKQTELKFICALCRAICNNEESYINHMKNHDVTSNEEVITKVESPTKALKKKKSSIQALSFEEPPAQILSPKVQTPNQLKRQGAVSLWNDSEEEDDIEHVGTLEPGEKHQEKTKNRTCQYCNKIFSSPEDVAQHIRSRHKMAQEYHCPHKGCVKKFNNINEYTFHLGTHALDDNKELHPITIPKCGICEKTFKTSAQLKHHSAQHTEARTHICEYCDAGFTSAQFLKQHLKTHTQERPYICGECGSTFARSDHLQQHSRTHRRDSTNRDPNGHEPTILTSSGHPPPF